MGIWPSDASAESDCGAVGTQSRRVCITLPPYRRCVRAHGGGGGVPERMIQHEGRWESDTYNVYTRNNVEDAGQVSRNLGVAAKGRRQPVQGPTWGKS